MPPDIDALIEQANQKAEAGKTEAALALLDQALKLDPASAYAWYSKGCLLSQQEQFKEAIACYAQAAQTAPPERAALPLFNMGNAFQALGDIDKALKCFELVLEADADFADAWINKGRILDDSGRSEEAIACYDRALQTQPDDVVALSNRGNSLRALGRHQEAIKSYQRSLKLEPENFAALHGVAECHYALGDMKKALSQVESCLKTHPQEAVAWCLMAVAQSSLGDHEEALKSIDRTLMLQEAPQAWNNKGEILGKLGRYAEGLKCFDKALSLHENYPPALFGKARALTNLERYDEAKALCERFLQVADANDDLRKSAELMMQICRHSR